MKKSFFLLYIFAFLFCKTMKYYTEIQLTIDLSYNHDLDNNDNFSPDNKWLAYDIRPEKGGIAASNLVLPHDGKTIAYN